MTETKSKGLALAILEKAKASTAGQAPKLAEDALEAAVGGIMNSVHSKDGPSLRRALRDFVTIVKNSEE